MIQYRLIFNKGKEIRFISHLDTVKLFERAIRRADIPINFSQGFNPHPKISFALPVPVGVTADTEYIDLELREEWAPERLQQLLNDNLPPGMRILETKFKSDKEAAMALVRQAEYEVLLPLATGISADTFRRQVTELMARDEIMVEKKTKKQTKQIDLKEGIVALTIQDVVKTADNNKVWLNMCLQAGNSGNIRVEDVLGAFSQYLQLAIDLPQVQIHRKRLLLADSSLI